MASFKFNYPVKLNINNLIERIEKVILLLSRISINSENKITKGGQNKRLRNQVKVLSIKLALFWTHRNIVQRIEFLKKNEYSKFVSNKIN